MVKTQKQDVICFISRGFFRLFIGFSIVLLSQGLSATEKYSLSEAFLENDYTQSERLLSERVRILEEANKDKDELGNATKKDLAGLFFARGKTRYMLENYQQAEADLLQSIDLKSIFPDYNYHYLGLVAQKQAELSKAKRYFNKVLNYRPKSHLQVEARLRLADIAIENKHWKSARRLLRYVERKKRSSSEHPFILEKLASSAIKRNNFWQACRWTRKLYRNYALHPVTKGWGVDLASVKIGKYSPKCKETTSDRNSRIRRLLWAGEVNIAYDEIQAFRRKSKDEYAADLLLVRYYNHKGDVEKSLATLQKHYDKRQYNFGYLQTLAKASAKLGKFPQAVGLYYKAYKLSPRGSKGRNSLFQAAYLSYQFQDYDGASRKYEELIKKFPRSGLARDAKWHTSWVRYLKGDYEGAYKGLSQVWKKRRRYRRSRTVTNDKIAYWKAMSLLRMNKKEEAKIGFMKLARKGQFTFYTISARSRVMELIGDQDLTRTPAGVNFNDFETSVEQLAEMEPEAPAKAEEVESEDELKVLTEVDELDSEEEALAKKEDLEESEREKSKSKSSAFVARGALGITRPSATDETEEITEEPLKVTNFRSKIMNSRFERALELMRFGMHDLARWELYDIEKRTSNRTYLKTLMEAYQRIGAYHRSAYIGQVFFSTERAKHGIEGAKYLWDFTYPQAYSEEVVKNTADFGVPAELAWGIMRQESHFRKTIRSPVGARGLMQIMPYTGDNLAELVKMTDYTVESLDRPEVNVKLGVRYLKRLMKKFDNKYPLVAAAYNAGPHRVDAWIKNFGHLDMDEFIEHIPFLETRLYVKKVTQNFHVYELLRGQKTYSLDVASFSQPVGLTYVGKLPTKESWN